MEDYKITVEESGVTSVRQKEEFDCKEKKQRILFITFYSGHNGRGETLFILNERGDWHTPHPDSIAADVLKFACSFRPKMPETFPEETFS